MVKIAEKFHIRPCGHKWTYNCVEIICEDGTKVLIPEKLMDIEEWRKI